MANLKPITSFGSNGTGNSNLNNPEGFCCDGEFIYICDYQNHRVMKWRLEGGSFVAKTGNIDESGNPISGSDDFGFNLPYSIIYYDGYLLITDSGNTRIKIYRADNLQLVRNFTPQGVTKQQALTDLITDGMRLYIFDALDQNVIIYNIKTMQYENIISLSAIIVSAAYSHFEKAMYTIDTNPLGNPQINKYSLPGFTLIDQLVAGSYGGTFFNMHGIAYKDHYVYTLEPNQIQIFNETDLSYVTKTGSSGSDIENISNGRQIKVYDKFLMLTDSGNDRLTIWNDYDVSRSFVPGGQRAIWSGLGLPALPINMQVSGQYPTIGGSDAASLNRWIEEEDKKAGVRWTEE